MTILYLIVWIKYYFSSISGFCAESGGELEMFFKAPDPEKTSGSIVIANRDVLDNTNVSRIITVYSWDKCDFLMEKGTADDGNQFSIQKLLKASGKWRGTNWSYIPDNKQLSYIKKLSKVNEDYLKNISSRLPDEEMFAKILGRGIDISDFISLEKQGGNVKGLIKPKRVPISGRVEKRGDEYIFVYNFVGSGGMQSNVIKLKEFDIGLYLPASITIYFVANGVIIPQSDFVILAMTNKPVKASLSPFILYKNNIEYIIEQVGEKAVLIKDGTRKEITMERPGTKKDSSLSSITGKSPWFIIGLIIVVSIITILLWVSLKTGGKS